jgi:hypothetical protein
MKTSLIVLAVMCACAFAAGNVAAAPLTAKSGPSSVVRTDAVTIPLMFSYQGKLTDTLGIPVTDTTHSINFRLYTVPSGGSPYWNETQIVRTRGGLFSTLLGSVTPVGTVPDAGALYLGMAVGGGAELAPRVRIASVPYAYKSDTANYALAGGGGGTPDSVPGSFAVSTDLRVYGKGRFGADCENNGTRAFVAGQENQANGNNASVTGGLVNIASGQGTFIGGGGENTAAGAGSVIAGGFEGGTAAGAYCGVIGGGNLNQATDSFAVVAGGLSNRAGRYGFVGGGRSDTAVSHYAAVLGGLGNKAGSGANDSFAAVAGGARNKARAYRTFVGGGTDNAAGGWGATIGGGVGNVANGLNSVVGGGASDTAAQVYCAVGSGLKNVAGVAVTDSAATVAGGMYNRAAGLCAFIGGGSHNSAGDAWATVGGGSSNSAPGNCATVAGGNNNSASVGGAAVGGGSANAATGHQATVSGGCYDSAAAAFATVGGGYGNTASESCATVGGGRYNTASGPVAIVGGGSYNSASAAFATVAGGTGNGSSGIYATVSGGLDNMATGSAASVSGGFGNNATGYYSTVAGGENNAARGMTSFAAGMEAKANHDGSFVWSDSIALVRDSIYSTGSNQWRVRARGGAWFFSNLAQSTGAYLAAGSNSWASACDSANKEDFRAVDRKALLDKVASLRVRDYKMRDQNDGTRHIGPVAQDFHAAFGVGETEKAINMADMDGVTLAAIQALYADNQQLRQELEALKAELAARK